MFPPVGARITRLKFAIILSSVVVIVVLFHLLRNQSSNSNEYQKCPIQSSNQDSLVPNRVHFVHFDSPSLPFVSFVCILAAHRSQRPDRIVLHTNIPKEEITADPRVSRIVGVLGSTFEIAHAAKPTHVFGQAIGNVYHSNDVFKIHLAIKQGGIFLDQARALDSFFSLNNDSIPFPQKNLPLTILTLVMQLVKESNVGLGHFLSARFGTL